jgi:iron complex outermembrane recepter protein
MPGRTAARSVWLTAWLAASLAGAGAARAQSVEDLRGLSIEELANIPVTSVSKSTEPLSDAAAAIYVISHDDIIRSGATTIPEILRLAPNLEVAQLNASTYAISARGFNVGDNAALSNKLLVLIDGRSVYTPLFGGVYWDMQSVPPETIDHIEVISGPGAALWGANAVNGVINIITKPAKEAAGGVLTIGAGNLQRGGSLQYGGALAPDLSYRVHVEGFDYSHYDNADGTSGRDGWSKPQGGFRVDWTPSANQVSLQGDIYAVNEDPDGFIEGRDLLASWRHQLDGGSSFQLQAYYDQAGRFANGGGPGLAVDTYDIEAQHSFPLGSWNSIVWGAGERVISYGFENTALQLVPTNNTLNLANVFGQDTMTLSERVKLTLGLKLEAEPYANIEPMPSARISWKATDAMLLWAAVSRAVRSPTPVDESIREFEGSLDVLNGSSSFRPENLTSYEAGTRVQAGAHAFFSVSTYYNRYDDLRSIELSPTVSGMPFLFGNLAAAHVFGVEVWGNYQPAPWWRLSAGFNFMHESVGFKAGSSQLGGRDFIADDPSRQASVRSTIDFGGGVSWYADVRYVGALPHPVVPEYAELNTRLAWNVTSRLELSASGFNLLHARHIEFFEDGQTDEIPRSFYFQSRWRF